MRFPHPLFVATLLTACGDSPPPEPIADAGQTAPGEEQDAGSTGTDAGTRLADITLHGIRLGILGEEGKPLHIVVVSDITGERVASVDTLVNGAESFTLPAILVPGHRYGFHLYVDMDENGACDPSREDGGDRGWSTTGILAQAEGNSVPFHTKRVDEAVCAHWN